MMGINESAVESETVYGRTEKRIDGFEWSNQESVGRGVELTMRAIGDGWRREPDWFSVSLVYGGRGGADYESHWR